MHIKIDIYILHNQFDVYVRDISINGSWDLPLESSSGKLSWKYVGSQLKRMKKQLFWQKWQIAQALK